MKTIFNFTDREDRISKTGVNPEILIRVAEKNSNTIYTPEIAIRKKFPPSSKIYIQPYSIEGYVGNPEYFGTIRKPSWADLKRLDLSHRDNSPCQNYRRRPFSSSAYAKIIEMDVTVFGCPYRREPCALGRCLKR